VPSKTFHFGPESLEVLIDLFESHLLLASLLEASTSMPPAGPQMRELAGDILMEADRRWVSAIRNHWPQAPDE